jgi:peroxiredoxin
MIGRGRCVGPLLLWSRCEGSTVGGGSAGLSRRLLGQPAPKIRLPFAPGEIHAGSTVSLDALAHHRSLVVCFYRGAGPDDAGSDRMDVERVSDEVARLEGWREHEAEFAELGYSVIAVSAQSAEIQAQFALDRLLTSFMFLSDTDLLLADDLGLPTVTRPGRERVYEPLTLLIHDGRISWVFYPLEHPRFDAVITTEWLRRQNV